MRQASDRVMSAAADSAMITALMRAKAAATTRAARVSAAGECPGWRRSAANRQIRVADPVTSARIPRPVASMLRLSLCNPAAAETPPETQAEGNRDRHQPQLGGDLPGPVRTVGGRMVTRHGTLMPPCAADNSGTEGYAAGGPIRPRATSLVSTPAARYGTSSLPAHDRRTACRAGMQRPASGLAGCRLAAARPKAEP